MTNCRTAQVAELEREMELIQGRRANGNLARERSRKPRYSMVCGAIDGVATMRQNTAETPHRRCTSSMQVCSNALLYKSLYVTVAAVKYCSGCCLQAHVQASLGWPQPASNGPWRRRVWYGWVSSYQQG